MMLLIDFAEGLLPNALVMQLNINQKKEEKTLNLIAEPDLLQPKNQDSGGGRRHKWNNTRE